MGLEVINPDKKNCSSDKEDGVRRLQYLFSFMHLQNEFIQSAILE